MRLRLVAAFIVAIPFATAPAADASHTRHHRCETKRDHCAAKAADRSSDATKRKKRRGSHKPKPARKPGPGARPAPGSKPAPDLAPVPAPAPPTAPEAPAEPAPSGSRWVPSRNTTWYWQLAGTVDRSKAVAAYDIDGVNNDAADIQALHAQGKRAICYLSAGTYEPGRPDSGQLAPYTGSGVSGWPGEKWLDHRQQGVRDVMASRIRMCADKGFDGLEPDNVDSYSNSSGFPLTADDQVSYNRFLADTAHANGLAVFLKNDGGQAAVLEPSFDGAISEECNQYNECDAFAPFLSNGKPVLNAEYGSSDVFCAADNAKGIMGARYDLALSGQTFQPCW
jgi:hypothetical protein